MAVRDRTTLSNRTKIVATLGPACASGQVLREMVRAGMDVARINFSHGDADKNLALLAAVRAAAKAEGAQLAILQDLQGPKLRVGGLPEGGLQLVEGLTAKLVVGTDISEGEAVPIPYERLGEDIEAGDTILLNDGQIELEVTGSEGRKIKAKVIVGGTLLSNQGVAVPSSSLAIESLTEKDERDLALGLEHGIDWLALSFVRTAEDVVRLKEKMAQMAPRDVSMPKIVVKIEKHEAVENFDAILEEADAVMVARGDLGLDTSAAQVPVTQKEIVAKCLVAAKPVIVATHMLSSMTVRPRPTRAEASDVANAVIDHADAVMLSEETAMGRFPVRSVQQMAEIARVAEESPLDDLQPEQESKGAPLTWSVAASAVTLARQSGAEAILVTTHSGFSARAVARYRPELPLYAATDDPQVRRQLLLSWGVRPLYVEGYTEPEQMVREALERVRAEVSSGRVVVVSGLSKEGEGYDSAVRVVDI